MRSGARKPVTIAVVMGKKLSQAAMSALGNRPVNPMLPRTTMTIGAIAMTGIVWLATIHGMSERSSVRALTIATASAIPKISASDEADGGALRRHCGMIDQTARRADGLAEDAVGHTSGRT